MGLKQYIKHKLAERKESGQVKEAARKEEGLRIQHLLAQKRLEEHKTRIEMAKASGRKAAIPKSVKIKEFEAKLSPYAKRAYAAGKIEGLKFLEDILSAQKKSRKRTQPRRTRRIRKR